MNWLRSLVVRFKAFRVHLSNRRAYKVQLLEAVGRGRLVPEEIQRLELLKKDLELTDEDIGRYRVKAYLAAYAAVKRNGIVTREENISLEGIQRYLRVLDSEIGGSRKELAHLRLLGQIQAGNLPTTLVSGLVMQKGETAHWSEPASIMEERVTNRRYVGGSSGVSFRIARGISYRVGGYRGHVVVNKRVVPVSTGSLVITNKRLVFLGDKKGFNSRLEKLLDVQLFGNGLRVEDGSGRSHTFRFQSRQNIDVVGAILSQAINSSEK
jgi:hypothetical protein